MTHYIKVKRASQQTPGQAKHKWGTDTIYIYNNDNNNNINNNNNNNNDIIYIYYIII